MKKILSIVLLFMVVLSGLFAVNNKADSLDVKLEKKVASTAAFTSSPYTNPQDSMTGFLNDEVELIEAVDEYSATVYASVLTYLPEAKTISVTWTDMVPQAENGIDISSVPSIPLTVEYVKTSYGTREDSIPKEATSLATSSEKEIVLGDPVKAEFSERAISHELKVSASPEDIAKAVNATYVATLTLISSTDI